MVRVMFRFITNVFSYELMFPKRLVILLSKTIIDKYIQLPQQNESNLKNNSFCLTFGIYMVSKSLGSGSAR